MRRLRSMRNQRGVAMVTVLFIGSALTVVTSVATFATIQEFRAGSDDRKAAEALSYAEAGIDRFFTYLKSGLLTYNQLNRAGCQDPPIALPTGQVGTGTFDAKLTVYGAPNATGADRFPIPPSSGACASRPISPHPGQGGDRTWFVIESTGRHPDATRVVRQVIALEPIGLPIGVYGNSFDPKAHPKYTTVSVVSETTFTDREKDVFTGLDPYYKIGDFFGGVTGASLTDAVPAAIHAVGGIYLKNSGSPEFTGPPNGTKNCTANSTQGNPQATATQSLWDSDGSAGSGAITSGCAAWPGPPGSGAGVFPNSSRFTQDQLQNFAKPRLSAEDHLVMKEAAQRYGVYCSFAGAGGTGGDTCIRAGQDPGGIDYKTYVNEVLATRNTFVVYIEFRSGAPASNNILNLHDVWPCSDDPALNKSVVVIVKNGGANWDGGAGGKFNGALIVDGNFSTTGKFTFQGTMVVLGQISLGSSASEATLTPCWVRNMPGPFFRAVPGHWSEVDR